MRRKSPSGRRLRGGAIYSRGPRSDILGPRRGEPSSALGAAVRPLNRHADRLSYLWVVSAPNIERRRIPATIARSLEDGVRRLNAAGLFQLTQIVPRRQEDDPLRVDDDDAPDVPVVAQQKGAFLFRERKVRSEEHTSELQS